MAHCLTQPRQGAVVPRREYRCSVSPRQRAMSLSHTNGNTAAGGHELSKGAGVWIQTRSAAATPVVVS